MEARFSVCTLAVVLLCCVSLGTSDEESRIAFFCGDKADMETKVKVLQCVEEGLNPDVLAVWKNCQNSHLPESKEEQIPAFCESIATDPADDFKKCYIEGMQGVSEAEVKNMEAVFETCAGSH